MSTVSSLPQPSRMAAATAASTSTSDALYRPSFFEMLAQDRLIYSLRPALRHVLVVIARRHSWVRRHVLGCIDEVFFSLMYFLERHYLWNYDASFSESFYGLKRMRIVRLRDAAVGTPCPEMQQRRALNNSDRRRALLLLIGVPYVRNKLEGFYNSLVSPATDEGFENVHMYNPQTEYQRTLPERWVRFAVWKLYPTFSSAVELLVFLYQCRYLFASGEHYSFGLHMLMQTVRRLSLSDMISQQRARKRSALQRRFGVLWRSTMSAAGSRADSLWTRFVRTLDRLGFLFADYAKWALVMSIWLLRFLEWWYSSESEIRSDASLPIPPPPAPAQPAPRGSKPPRDCKKCAICLQPRVNPTCTPTGFVYCYACIHGHVDRHGECPISKVPCVVEQLRKIYET